MLVNDLDLRLTDTVSGTVYEPWILDPANPSDAATTGDNFRDNVERIDVSALPPGNYRVTVSHKASIGAGQDYSLLASHALSATPPATAVAELHGGTDGSVKQVVHPNPFASGTSVSFRLPARSSVSVEVFDLAGRLVRSLIGGEMEAGAHRLDWDARDDAGRTVPSGIYFARLTVNGEPTVQKMTLVRGER